MNMWLTKQICRLMLAKDAVTVKMKDALKDERGDTNILSIVLVLVVVVGLAVIFRDNLTTFTANLWQKISGDIGSF